MYHNRISSGYGEQRHAAHRELNQGHYYLSCATFYAQQQAYAIAGKYYQKAAYLLKKEKAPCAAIYALRGLGIVRCHSQQIRSGIRLISQAATAYGDQGHRYEEATTLLLLGKLYDGQQQYAFALACYEAASEICASFLTGHGYHGLKAQAQAEMAQLCIKTDHPESALPYYLEALKLYEDIALVSQVVEVCRALAQIYEKLAQFMTALHYRQRVIMLCPLGCD